MWYALIMDRHNDKNLGKEVSIITLPSWSWKHLWMIQKTQRKIEDIVARNQWKLPTQVQYSFGDKNAFIEWTDGLLTELNDFRSLLMIARWEQLGDLLQFIREQILSYRMFDHYTLWWYKFYLEEKILWLREWEWRLTPEEREVLMIEIEYISSEISKT